MNKFAQSAFVLLVLVACAKVEPLVPILPLARTPDAPFRAHAPPPDSSFSTHFVEPHIHHRILSNGFTVLVVSRRDTPLVASAVVCRKAGHSDSAGLGQVTAEMLLEGTLTDAGHIERRLSLGSRTAFATMLPDAAIIEIETLQHRALQTVELLARTVRRPAFDPGAFGTVRLNLANAAAADSSTFQHHVMQSAREGLFGKDSPFALPPLGTSKGILAMQPDWAVLYYRSRYRPDESALIVVGDVKPGTLFEEAERWFGDWPRPTTPAPDPSPLDSALRETKRQVHAFREGDQLARAWLVTLGPAANARDFPEFSAAVSILAGSIRARAGRLLRFHDARSYGVSGTVTPTAHYSEMVVEFSVRGEDLEQALTGLLGELKRLQKEPPSETELDLAVALADAQVASQLVSVSGTLSLLAESYAQGLQPWLLGETWRRRRSLTPEDIQQSAADWLQPERVQLVVSGTLELDRVLAKFGDVKWYRLDSK